VALTEAFRKDLVRRGIPAGKIAVVINGVELSRYSPRARDPRLAAQWGIRPESFVVGYIGTLGMAHGLESVLDAAERFGGAGVDFLFVGPGAERARLEADARRRGLTNVIFIPPQAKERMPDFWSLCDVALVHLKNDPVFETVIPSKIFEAMAMGLPILLGAPPGEASRIVEGEQAGVWVPAQDLLALAAAVSGLRADPAWRCSLAAHSHAAAPRYSRERQARHMLAVLERVAAGEDGATPELI